MNAQADQQAARIAEMADYEQLKNELVSLKNKGMTTGNTDNHKHLINIKDVKIDNFTGEEAKFTDFVEDMKTYADVITPSWARFSSGSSTRRSTSPRA